VNGERFFHAFFQNCAQIHQLAMQTVRSALGVGVIRHLAGVLKLPLHVGFMFVRQMIGDLAFFYELGGVE
jgi:hypothetical protein